MGSAWAGASLGCIVSDTMSPNNNNYETKGFHGKGCAEAVGQLQPPGDAQLPNTQLRETPPTVCEHQVFEVLPGLDT